MKYTFDLFTLQKTKILLDVYTYICFYEVGGNTKQASCLWDVIKKMKRLVFALFLFLLCFATSALAQETRPRMVVNCQLGSEVYPGIEAGEVFLTTISTEYVAVLTDSGMYLFEHDFRATEKNFTKISFKTKRLGKTAYQCKSGEVITGFRPVFISKDEWLEHNKQIKNFLFRTLIASRTY